MKITVKGRLLNNAIFSPKTDETYDKTQYAALVVLNPGEAEKVTAARDEALKEKFGKVPPKYTDWTVREGDDPEFENTYENKFIHSKSDKLPKAMVREDGALRTVDEDEGLIYAGAYVAVSIDVYAYEFQKQKGVSTGLRAIMFVKHGDALGGAVVTNSEFDDIDSDLEEELE